MGEMKTKKLLHECLYVCAAFVLGVFQVGAGVDITGNTILQSDTDWREQGVVTIADDATLDLNGFLLQVDAIAGSGRITDSKCYAVLDYVQATGRQRVPTGYIPGPNTAVEVDFVSEHDSNHCLYGTQKWNANQFLCMVDGRKLYFFGAGKYISLDGTSRYRSYLRGGKMSAIQQDSLIGAYVEANQTNTAGSELMYFGNSDDADFAKYPGYYKLYGSRVWDSCELKLDLVPVSNVVTSAVGLFNRVNGELLESNTDVPLVPGVPTGATLGIGSLRVEATSGDSVAGFSGTVDAQVRTFVDGTFSLAANADWRAFGACAIDGCIDLNGHDLTLNSLGGIGTITDSNCPYQRLDYVQATGKQRVPTGYVPGSGTKVEVDFVPMGNATTACTQPRNGQVISFFAWCRVAASISSERAHPFRLPTTTQPAIVLYSKMVRFR